MKRGQKSRVHNEYGFTLIESALIVLIIGMLAVIAIPKILSTDKYVVYTTSRQIMADMRYARSLAISRAEDYIVRFSPSGGPYTIYQILPAAGGSPEKTMEISDQVTCIPLGGFSDDLLFTVLGSAATGGQIISVSGGGNNIDISVISATGRVY